jgi:hypothetical protein
MIAGLDWRLFIEGGESVALWKALYLDVGYGPIPYNPAAKIERLAYMTWYSFER